MFFNGHLNRLKESDIVKDFMKTHRMHGKMCIEGGSHSFILYRFPYVVGFWETPVKNYLEIVFVDLNAGLLAEGGPLLRCSLDLALQSFKEMNQRNVLKYPEEAFFTSFGERKVGDLSAVIEAIGKLLPLIELKGGLRSMKDGSFDPRFDFSDSVGPVYPRLKERYLDCVDRALG